MGRKIGFIFPRISKGNNIVQSSIYAGKNRNDKTKYATTSNHASYFKNAKLDRISIFIKNKLIKLAGRESLLDMFVLAKTLSLPGY